MSTLRNLISILLVTLIVPGSTFADSLSLILLGNENDSSFIRISRSFSSKKQNIIFELCANESSCERLGARKSYDDCQIKELVKTPWWAVPVDGGSAFAKAADSWASFARILTFSNQYEAVKNSLEGRTPIRVPLLNSRRNPPQVNLLVEANKITTVLAKVDQLECNRD